MVELEDLAPETPCRRGGIGKEEVTVVGPGQHARLRQATCSVDVVVTVDTAGRRAVEDARAGVVGREPLDQAAVGRRREGALGGADVVGEDVVVGVDRAAGVGGLAVEHPLGVWGGVLAGPILVVIRARHVEVLAGEAPGAVVELLADRGLLEGVVGRAAGVVLARVGRVVPDDEAPGSVVQQAHLTVGVPRGHQLGLGVCRRGVVVLLLVLVPVDQVTRMGLGGRGGGSRGRSRRGGQGRHRDRHEERQCTRKRPAPSPHVAPFPAGSPRVPPARPRPRPDKLARGGMPVANTRHGARWEEPSTTGCAGAASPTAARPSVGPGVGQAGMVNGDRRDRCGRSAGFARPVRADRGSGVTNIAPPGRYSARFGTTAAVGTTRTAS